MFSYYMYIYVFGQLIIIITIIIITIIITIIIIIKTRDLEIQSWRLAEYSRVSSAGGAL